MTKSQSPRAARFNGIPEHPKRGFVPRSFDQAVELLDAQEPGEVLIVCGATVLKRTENTFLISGLRKSRSKWDTARRMMDRR